MKYYDCWTNIIVYELQIYEVILLLASKETVESSSRSDDCLSKDYKRCMKFIKKSFKHKLLDLFLIARGCNRQQYELMMSVKWKFDVMTIPSVFGSSMQFYL